MKLLSLLGLCLVLASRLAAALEPGATVTLTFPELGPMHDKLPAACEVSVPSDYDPARPAPLLVWFSGGKGSQSVAGARGLVDFDRFLVVALPYPDGVLPRLAAKDGARIDRHWDYQRVMLERIQALAPNIDPARRFVAGTSSGGHLIAYGLDRGWPGFAEYFTHFVIHEGGSEPLAKGFPGAKDKRLLVVYGEKSESIAWRGWFNWHVLQSGARADIVGLPDSRHGLGDDGRRAIRAWIDAETSGGPDALTPAR